MEKTEGVTGFVIFTARDWQKESLINFFPNVKKERNKFFESSVFKTPKFDAPVLTHQVTPFSWNPDAFRRSSAQSSGNYVLTVKFPDTSNNYKHLSNHTTAELKSSHRCTISETSWRSLRRLILKIPLHSVVALPMAKVERYIIYRYLESWQCSHPTTHKGRYEARSLATFHMYLVL